MASSRESTVTLGLNPDDVSDKPPPPEEVPDSLLDDISAQHDSKRLIVAVDFGTTYSCVSFVALKAGEVPVYLPLDRIETIGNYFDGVNLESRDEMLKQVPTELMYPLKRGFRQQDDLPHMESGEATASGGGVEDEGNISAPGQRAAAGDVVDSNDDIDVDMSDIFDSTSLRWGYSVHEARSIPTLHVNPSNKPLSRFKLLLDESPLTETIREELSQTIKSLKRLDYIKTPLQIIADFLTCLLRHTKAELLKMGYDDSWKAEMVLCVPAIWTQKSCRSMQSAMAYAMEQTRFLGADLQNNSIENLFIVSEPEAAAAYVLASDPYIQPGDTFVLLDAGGGTVDANTYTISRTTPLRLIREVVEPGGGLFGSSYLNEGFQKMLVNLLKDEHYLETGGKTIEGIVERIMINDFEYRVKRSFDLYGIDPRRSVKAFHLSGLRDNPDKRFSHECVNIPLIHIRPIFETLLKGIAEIMEDQITRALQKGCRVEKVILQGGFAASKSLYSFMDNRIKRFNEKFDQSISLKRSNNTVTAVASGAVLRAFNKEQGPRRVARSSYGILRTEPFKYYPEHVGLNPSYDRHDGLPYIKNTILWVMRKDAEVPPVWRCRAFRCHHTFNCWPNRSLICREVLFVIDGAPDSHYRFSHPMNDGAEKLGEVLVDFTFLRDRGLIQPIEPGPNEAGRIVGTRHYRVDFTMVIRVVDRDLQCYAIYDGQVVKRCQINIASAFTPGVK